MTPEEIKIKLQLEPNNEEGGFFASVYQSEILIPNTILPGFPPTNNLRPLSGAIYYFLDQSGCSILHKVTGDMVYHFYSGDPVEMLLLYPEQYPIRTEICIFSNDVLAGGKPMKAIPGGTWLGSRLLTGGNYALMGVTMAPGFSPTDYSIGDRKELIESYPEQKSLIEILTKD
ncbi:hypothetical protein CLU82_3572 [Flavobacterium sp. 5]|nr:hypothetical protein CLU82_3572 [Flavobacterium sp. 5]